jgi:hypothetical protein
MERRIFRRISIDLPAERISGDTKGSVFIDNISEKGIHLISASSKSHVRYAEGKEIDLRLSPVKGETIMLRCVVKWCFQESGDEKTDSIGLEVIDPPPGYVRFVRSITH